MTHVAPFPKGQSSKGANTKGQPFARRVRIASKNVGHFTRRLPLGAESQVLVAPCFPPFKKGEGCGSHFGCYSCHRKARAKHPDLNKSSSPSRFGCGSTKTCQKWNQRLKPAVQFLVALTHTHLMAPSCTPLPPPKRYFGCASGWCRTPEELAKQQAELWDAVP